MLLRNTYVCAMSIEKQDNDKPNIQDRGYLYWVTSRSNQGGIFW